MTWFVWTQTRPWLSCGLYLWWLSFLLSFNPLPSTLAPREDAHGPETPLLPWPWTRTRALCFGFLSWEMERIQIPYLTGLLWELNEIERIKSLEQSWDSMNTQLISSRAYSFLKDGAQHPGYQIQLHMRRKLSKSLCNSPHFSQTLSYCSRWGGRMC